MNLEYFLRKFRLVRRLEQKVQQLEAEKSRLEAEMAPWWKFAPPGHFYSPLPSPQEIAGAFARGGSGPPFPAVDLREAEQFALAQEFAGYYPDQPFPEDPTPGRRFYLNNGSFGRYDAIILYCMLRHLQPRRIIEVGSGFSSAAMLDLNSLVMNGRMQLTFIDPDMTRLRPLLGAGGETPVTLIEQRVQEVPLDLFATLEANDVLFIDSSHVSKVGSDVNRLFFQILPMLKPGVHVHIHDVTGDLEYPRDWLDEGRAWNELYLLRAFLMYNHAFRIKFFTSWFHNHHHQFLRERMPDCARSTGGQMWLCKNFPDPRPEPDR